MKKINFKDISNELSRSEMKQVMAGTGDGCSVCELSYKGCHNATMYYDCDEGWWSVWFCGNYEWGFDDPPISC